MQEIEATTTSLTRGFVPVVDMPKLSSVEWDLDVPSFDKYQIALNLGRLASLTRLGGFGTMAISQAPLQRVEGLEEGDGESHKSEPPLRALIHGGQAGSLENDILHVINTRHYLWPDCTLLVSPPTGEQLEAAKKPAHVWAHHFDYSIKLGLYAAARQHLVLETEKFNKMLMVFQTLSVGSTAFAGIVSLKGLAGTLSLNQVINMGEAIFINKYLGIPPKERRFSLFFGTQIDRLALLRVRLATSKIVKTIPAQPN